MEHRFISKLFKCENCNKRFKKLVHVDDTQTSCENCGQTAIYLEENEFNREEADRTYRLAFDHTNVNFERQFHPATDIFDRNPSNIYGDPQRRPRVTPQPTTRPRTPSNANNANINQPERNGPIPSPTRQGVVTVPTTINIIPGLIFNIPYSVSPFRGSVRRQPAQNYFGNFFSDFFVIPNNDFFMDNFASNFSSNFYDPMTRVIFLQSMQNQPSGNPPASKEALKKLKKFKMNEEFCKKKEGGDKSEKNENKEELEYPCCSVCLTEISKNQDTTLIPCGHMFHDECIMKWLNMHNSCPVCRYELANENNSERTTTRNINNPGTGTGNTNYNSNNNGNINQNFFSF